MYHHFLPLKSISSLNTRVAMNNKKLDDQFTTFFFNAFIVNGVKVRQKAWYFITITLLLITPGTFLFAGEKLASTFVVDAGSTDRFNTPVSADLNGLGIALDEYNFKLYEIRGQERRATPCQLENGNFPRLWWILSGMTKKGEKRTFQLMLGDSSEVRPDVICEQDEQKLIVKLHDKNVLQYNYAVTQPPEGVSSLYKRSGFIHPLWSPDGHVLTRIQPPDHRHHYGIWNPWTKTHYEGKEVDFWNLGKGEGTVRFAGFLSLVNGPVFGGFKARQEHIDFMALGEDKVALNEVWDVRVWNISQDDQKVWLWDLTTTLNCASSPIDFIAYRYGGGIGFRATEQWTKENSRVLTSEGKSRAEADGTRARWCDVNGEFADSTRSGVLFMSYPGNREHPEPMRIWPLNANKGRGDVFFEFCPIRHKSWHLYSGRDYVLRYRMLVYDRSITKAQAEQLWQDFAHPPRVEIK